MNLVVLRRRCGRIAIASAPVSGERMNTPP
jgi:hypothetical protein